MSSSSCSANATRGSTCLPPSLANEAAPGEAQSPSEDDEESDAKEVAEASGGTQVDAFVLGIGKSHRRSDVSSAEPNKGETVRDVTGRLHQTCRGMRRWMRPLDLNANATVGCRQS